MKSISSRYIGIVAILLASASYGIAQTSGYYNTQTVAAPNSVRPGSLNYVEGQVSANGQALDPQAVGRFSLAPGQTLETGDGYAEVLLTPGTFLRVGHNSEVRMTTAGLADTRVELARGSALLEVDQMIEGTRLSVGLANTSANVLKKGLYSFDATRQAVRVLDGRVKLISQATSREIGKHDQVLLANGDNLKKTDFNESLVKNDSLYVWSEARSRQESGQNQLAAENSAGYVPAGTGWFWDPYSNYYGFWPNSAFLYSPFGFGFYGGYYAGYGGYYPGFYRGGGYYRGYAALRYGRPTGVHAVVGGFHSNAVGGFSGGFHSAGGFHGGGGGHR